MVDQVILIPDLIEHHLGVVRTPQHARGEHRILQLWPMDAGQRAPVRKPHAVFGADDDVLVDFEILDEDIQDAPRHRRVDFEQRQCAVAQLLEAAIDGLQQVVRFVFLNHHVGVADDAEEMRAFHLGAGEQLLDVALDDIFEERERQARLGGDVIRQRDEAREHVRHFDAGELRASAVAHHDRQVLAQIRDVGERMSRVERERRQDGKDVRLEVVRQVLGNARRVVRHVEEVDAFRFQQRPQRLRPAA